MSHYSITDQRTLSSIEGYSMRKALADRIALAYDNTAHLWDYASKIRGCGQNLIVRSYETGETEIAHALFCRCRLCPMCAWRRSLKAYGELSEIMDYIDNERRAAQGSPYKYVLYTLTVENCEPLALPEALDRMLSGLASLMRTSEWKRAIKGAHRSLEITYNSKSMTFHPHFHLICAVNPSYFNSSAYISQAKLTELWQRCCKLPYIPICNARKVEDQQTGLREVSKYVTKETDFTKLPLDGTSSVLAALHSSIHGRKLFARYGIFRQAARALKMTDEDGDLINVNELEPRIRKDLHYSLLTYTYIPLTGYINVDWDGVPDWQKPIYNALDKEKERHEEEDFISKELQQ